MAAVDRGFVQRIDIGRAGLVTVVVVLGDGSTGTYVISDLDADPERFNERLSKLAVLRDAMNRAEPVEIEHDPGTSGEEIERAVRITRDAIDPLGTVNQLLGLVVSIRLNSQNALTAGSDQHDVANIELVTTTGAGAQVVLDMQTPERAVAVQQLEMLRDAQAHGALARLVVDTSSTEVSNRIIEVGVDDDLSSLGGEGATTVSGFVESLSLIRLPLSTVLEATLANVGFTTAPEFTGPGNTASLDPFTPTPMTFLMARGSLTYDLFEAGLRDKLRMRVAYTPVGGGDLQGSPVGRGGQVVASPGQPAAGGEPAGAPAATAAVDVASVAAGGGGQGPPLALALAAELLAPLASASRPVWACISREMLDKGPDTACIPGVPTSDLTPQTLRDLRIPYPAEWIGLGCFNHGVYRFQLQLPGTYKLYVDCDELCLFDSDQPGIRFGYACLDGDHTVKVAVDAWTCDNDFVMDVYRLR